MEELDRVLNLLQAVEQRWAIGNLHIFQKVHFREMKASWLLYCTAKEKTWSKCSLEADFVNTFGVVHVCNS